MAWETHGFTPTGESVAWVIGSMPIHEWMRKKNIERVVRLTAARLAWRKTKLT